MKVSYHTGIDIGSSFIRTVIISTDQSGHFKIVGNSVVLAGGVQKGHVVSPKEFAIALKDGIKKASESAGGIKIKMAHVAIGSTGLSSSIISGNTIVGRTDKMITHFDLEKSYQAGINKWKETTHKILHKIPLAYKIDGKEVDADPIGMQGSKIEVKFLVISILSQYLEKMLEGFSRAGIELESIVASPLGTSILVLKEKEAIAGAMIADIGQEVTTCAVFENGQPISVFSLPIGGNSITEDIALTLKLDLDSAESIKIGTNISNHPKKMIDEIIEARCEDIFEIINKELKKIGRNGLLPAGITLTGGGSRLTNIVDMTKKHLSLPAKIGVLDQAFENSLKLKDNAWFNAVGVVLYSLHDDNDPNEKDTYKNESTKTGFLSSVKSILKQFLPIFFFLIFANMSL